MEVIYYVKQNHHWPVRQCAPWKSPIHIRAEESVRFCIQDSQMGQAAETGSTTQLLIRSEK